MNFIYSIILFAIFSLSAFGVSTQIPSGDLHCFFIICMVINGLISIVFIGCMVFRQMELSQNFREGVNKIRALNYEIISKLKALELYKSELQDALTKIYPDYERELFKGMNPSDSEHLSAIMVKYPELKFNGILTEYTNGIKARLNKITELEENVIREKRNLEDINTSGWKFGVTQIPAEF
jgi:hypothetical protein